jgi:hypothetical protein
MRDIQAERGEGVKERLIRNEEEERKVIVSLLFLFHYGSTGLRCTPPGLDPAFLFRRPE